MGKVWEYCELCCNTAKLLKWKFSERKGVVWSSVCMRMWVCTCMCINSWKSHSVLSLLQSHFSLWIFPKRGHSKVSLYFEFCPAAFSGLLWWFVLRKYFRLIFYLLLLKEYQLSWHSIILKASVNKFMHLSNPVIRNFSH